MKRRIRLIVCMTAFAMVMTTAGAFACTGMYVGRDVSKEGTTLIARSEDQGSGAYNKMFKVQKRITKSGRYYKDTGTGFKVKLPKTTYKFTYVPDSSDAEDGQYPASCTNEYGVAVVGTVSTEVSEEYEKADPVKDTGKGLREAILPGLVACQVKSAKQGAQLLARLHDKYGAEEWNTILLSDKKEAWIFENYGGHTYCAMKLPTDKVAVFGNQIMIGTVDPGDKSNYIFSKNLFSTIDKVGAVKEDGKYNLAKSIAGFREEYSNMRTWEGHRVLAPSDAGDYDNDKFYPLLYSPDEKVSVTQIMKLFRDRYEGTKYDMSDAANATRRPIGTTRSSDVHIIQTYAKLPTDACQVQWLLMGNAEHSVFVPSFSGITDTAAEYKVDGSAASTGSAYWMFKRNATLAQSDRKFLSKGTKDFWSRQEAKENELVKKQLKTVTAKYKKSKTAGRAYVTSVGKAAAKKQLNNSTVLYRALEYTATYNDNDRGSDKGKVTFTRPVSLKIYAQSKGFKVTVKGNRYTLKKGKDTFVLKNKAKSVYKNGEYTDDLIYPVYKVGKTVYAPAGFTGYLK